MIPEDESKRSRSNRDANPHNDEIATAWPAYVASPVSEADQFLRAIDPLILQAVRRWGKNKLERMFWPDVAQEVRCHLVGRGFLLRARGLQRSCTEEGAENSTEEATKSLVQTIKNHIYMVTLWHVKTMARRERSQAKMRASLAKETKHESAVAGEITFAPSYRLSLIKASLRRLGNDRAETVLFLDYFRGRINQRELGEKLGLQQPAISKRIALIRRDLARIKKGLPMLRPKNDPEDGPDL